LLLAIFVGAYAHVATLAQDSDAVHTSVDRSQPRLSSPQVLVISSDDPSQEWIQQLTAGLSGVPAQRGQIAPSWYFEFVDVVRFPSDAAEDRFTTAIRDKYRSHPIDLVVVIANSPEIIGRAEQIRAGLWPTIPMLVTNYGTVLPPPAFKNASMLSFEYGIGAALATMKRMFPDTAQVAIVAGAQATERVLAARVAADIKATAALSVLDLGSPPLDELLGQVGRLPEHTILYLTSGGLDGDGNPVNARRQCELVSAAANRPTIMLGAQFLVSCPRRN
jgi:hypothetical protein